MSRTSSKLLEAVISPKPLRLSNGRLLEALGPAGSKAWTARLCVKCLFLSDNEPTFSWKPSNTRQPLLLGWFYISPCPESIRSKPRIMIMAEGGAPGSPSRLQGRRQDLLAKDRALRAAGFVHELGDC